MQPLDFIGWKVTGLRNRMSDRLWERRLGISTHGRKLIAHKDAVRYQPFAYSSVLAILRHMDLASDDVFVDIGCGKGRVVCAASQFQMQRIIGIEIDEELSRIARENADRTHRKATPIEIVNVDASAFDYRDCTALFMFHPFGPGTMQLVAAAMQRSLLANPRSIRLAYMNPMHEQALQNISGFRRVEHWTSRPWSGLKHDVSFWSNASDGR